MHTTMLTAKRRPPGTGKSTFLVNVICRRLATDPDARLLVTAPTNRAVTVLAERFLSVADGGGAEALACKCNAVLVGVEDKLMSNTGDDCFSPADALPTPLRGIFAYTWIETLAAEYKSLLSSLKRLRPSRKFGSSSDGTMNALMARAETSKQKSDPEDDKMSALIDQVKASKSASMEEVNALVERAENIKAMNARSRDGKISKLVERAEKPKAKGSESETIETLIARAGALNTKVHTGIPSHRSICDCAKMLLRRLNEAAAAEVLEGSIEASSLHYLQMERAIGHGDDLIESLAGMESPVPELLATARVIFCTLSTAGASILKQTRKVDDLLIDEAAAATESEICIPFHLRPNRMLAVGDREFFC